MAPSHLSPLASLLQRNLSLIKGDSLFVLQSPDKGARDLLRVTLPNANLHFHHFDLVSHLDQRDESGDWQFGPWRSPKSLHPHQALGFLSRGRSLMEMSSLMTAQTLKPGASLILLGMKKEGAGSLQAWIEEFLGPVLLRDTARHGILYHVLLEKNLSARTLESWAESFDIPFMGKPWKICSLPGVFSQGRVDPGTELLLGILKGQEPPSSVLDLGCGSGILGLAAKILWPKALVELSDANALALEATRRTLENNGLSDTTLIAADLFLDNPKSYDLILSNPPFHDGNHKDFSFIDRLLRDSADHLNPGGRLVLVANRTLPYAKRISTHHTGAKILAENPGYRVYEARRP